MQRKTVIWTIGPILWGWPLAIWGFLDHVGDRGTPAGSLKFNLFLAGSLVLGYAFGLLWTWLVVEGVKHLRR